MEKLVRHARPQFDVRPRFVRVLARVGFIRKRRKSPRPHLQAPRNRIVGDADDSLLVVVVDHAPKIAALHIGRRVRDAHRRPVTEVAQFFKTAPARACALVAARQIARPGRRAVGLDRRDDFGAAGRFGIVRARSRRERRARPVLVVDCPGLRISQHHARIERGAIGFQRDVVSRL